MAEFDSIRDGDCFGFGINDFEAGVMVEGGTNVVVIATTEGPCAVEVGLGMDDDTAANGVKGSGGIVKGVVAEVGPCR